MDVYFRRLNIISGGLAMMKDIGLKAFLCVLMIICTAPFVSAGWFDNAVENAKERIGTRAVDETANGSYDAAKDAVLNKDKGGSKTKSTPKSSDGSSLREPDRHRPAAGLAGDAIDDDHFIQTDDFFVSTSAMEKNAYIYVSLSKMVTEPSPRTKGEAEFFKVKDGSSVWSKYFYQSVIARDGEIRLGTQVIIFEGRQDDGVYLPPDTKEEARGGTWFLARVTDVTDLYRGYVTVSGNYKISIRNLRTLLKAQPASR